MSPGGSSVRVRMGALLLVVVLLATSLWLVWREMCELGTSDEASAIATPAPLDVDVRAASPEEAGNRVERPQRVRVRTPTAPAEEADAETLWSFGEEFLGWAPRADVDLSQHSSEELRAWIEQDLRIDAFHDRLGYADQIGYTE